MSANPGCCCKACWTCEAVGCWAPAGTGANTITNPPKTSGRREMGDVRCGAHDGHSARSTSFITACAFSKGNERQALTWTLTNDGSRCWTDLFPYQAVESRHRPLE